MGFVLARSKRRQKRQPPVSLHPLEPEEALAGLFQVKPEKGDNAMARFQEEDRIRIAENARGPASDHIGTEGHIGSIEGRETSATSASSRIEPMPPVSEWEQLYLVKLDGVDDTILIQESWLEAV